jgi:hypothetical protein
MMEPTPLRPDDQVAGGFLVLRLGGQDFEVKVLPIALSRKWLAASKEAVVAMKGTAEGLQSFEDVADFIAGQSTAMMDLLLAYDALGNKALPEREWIDTTATDRECYEAWKRVTAATSPLAEEVLRIAPNIMPELIEAFRQAVTKGTAVAVAMNLSKRTKPSRPSTAGPPTSSKPTSPTSSSPSTPRSSPSGAKRKRSPN